MKVLVLSDIHGDRKRFKDILKQHEDAEQVLSLGDTGLKRKLLQKHDVIAIKGNTPFDAGFTYEHVMILRERRILLTHGHKYKVKSTHQKLYQRMLDEDCHIAMYGHTHAVAFQEIAGRYILPPGSAGDARGENASESYAVLTFEKGEVTAQWYDADSHVAFRKEIMKV